MLGKQTQKRPNPQNEDVESAQTAPWKRSHHTHELKNHTQMTNLGLKHHKLVFDNFQSSYVLGTTDLSRCVQGFCELAVFLTMQEASGHQDQLPLHCGHVLDPAGTELVKGQRITWKWQQQKRQTHGPDSFARSTVPFKNHMYMMFYHSTPGDFRAPLPHEICKIPIRSARCNGAKVP